MSKKPFKLTPKQLETADKLAPHRKTGWAIGKLAHEAAGKHRGTETKEEIIAGGPQTPREDALKAQGSRHNQIAQWIAEGVPMDEIRRRVAAGALAQGEKPSGSGPRASIKSAE